MTRNHWLAPFVALLATGAAPAGAATITRSYTTTLDFAAQAPVTRVTFDYSLTYDPLVDFTDKAVDTLTASSNLSSFSVPAVFTRGNPLAETVLLYVGGAPSGAGTQLNAVDDFGFYFSVTATGIAAADGIPVAPTTGSYVYAGASYRSTSGTTILSPAVTPVPEPAGWATMLLGFGGIGAAVRRRHRRTPLRLAASGQTRT